VYVPLELTNVLIEDFGKRFGRPFFWVPLLADQHLASKPTGTESAAAPVVKPRLRAESPFPG
jgi:hypothetical protein